MFASTIGSLITLKGGPCSCVAAGVASGVGLDHLEGGAAGGESRLIMLLEACEDGLV